MYCFRWRIVAWTDVDKFGFCADAVQTASPHRRCRTVFLYFRLQLPTFLVADLIFPLCVGRADKRQQRSQTLHLLLRHPPAASTLTYQLGGYKAAVVAQQGRRLRNSTAPEPAPCSTSNCLPALPVFRLPASPASASHPRLCVGAQRTASGPRRSPPSDRCQSSAGHSVTCRRPRPACPFIGLGLLPRKLASRVGQLRRQSGHGLAGTGSPNVVGAGRGEMAAEEGRGVTLSAWSSSTTAGGGRRPCRPGPILSGITLV